MTDTKQGKMRSPFVHSEPSMVVKTKGLEEETFYCGRGMQAKCLQSSKSFLDYVGRTYGESERQSILANDPVITDMEEPEDIQTEADFKKLSFREQRTWDKAADNWARVTREVNKNLSKAYSVLWALCHVGLQQVIMSDRDHEFMKEGDAGELHRLVQKICNGNSSTENPFLNLMEAYCNFHLIKGDSFESLSLHHEAFHKQSDALAQCGGWVGTPEFRDIHMAELERRDMRCTAIYSKLLSWRTEENWISTDKDQRPPRSAEREAIKDLVEQHRTCVCIKRSGPMHEQYRMSLQNAYTNNIGTWPNSVSQAQHNIERFRNAPAGSNKVINGQANLTQQDFNSVQDPADAPDQEQASSRTNPTAPPANFQFSAGTICFKCDREGHSARDCWFTTKQDGSPLNPKAVTDKKHDELHKSKRRSRGGGSSNTNAGENASQHFISTDIIPTLEEFLDMSDAESIQDDDQCAFVQCDQGTRQTTLDLRHEPHAHNQASRVKKPHEVSLDSCSTCDIFVNDEFPVDIRRCKWTLVLRTQSGRCEVNLIGNLPGVGTVWYCPEGSANILSMHRMVVNSGWSINFSTDQFCRTGRIADLCCACVTYEGVGPKFHPTKQGLHALDCSKWFQDNTKEEKHVFGKEIIDDGTHCGMAMCDGAMNKRCFLNDHATEAMDTIKKSRERFTKRDQARADLVRRFQHVAGHPSDATMICAAATNSIKNSPFARRDIKLALDVLGRSKCATQGKTTRTQPDAASDEIVAAPRATQRYYSNVVLFVDAMHVNKIPFLISISKHMHCAGVKALDNLKIPTLETSIKSMLRACSVRGFHVTEIHVDIQFKAMQDRGLLDVKVNVVSREEHVPDIERFIRVVKERCRCHCAMPPHNKLPRMMITHLLRTVVFCIDAFVWRDGVSQFLSPMAAVEGINPDFHKHFHLIFGECVHTCEGTTNDMVTRTVGALALGPSGNTQGGVRCYSLLTGRVLHRAITDVARLKMPEEAMRRLACKARKQKAAPGMAFADRHNAVDMDASVTGVEQQATATPINIDEQYHPDVEADERETDSLDSSDDEHNNTNDMHEPNEETPEDNDDTQDAGVASEDRADEMQPPEDEDSDSDEDAGATRTRSGRISKPHDYARDFPDLHQESHAVKGEKGLQLRPYYLDENWNGRLSKGTQIAESFFTDDLQIEESPTHCKHKIKRLDQEEYQLHKEALAWCDYQQADMDAMVHKVKQMSIREGIRKHGKEGKASAMKEAKNLVENDCFGETVHAELTQEMKDEALPILMFMVLKRNGSSKTRGVADGSVQRLHTNEEDVSSPTPDFYAFKFVCAVIAREARDAATVDLPGFFLQTDQEGNELTLLKLTGEAALLLVECDPEKWKKHLKKENGKWITHVVCEKAIYGTMNAALLAYKKLAKLFKSWDLIMNPYDPCVWNKDVEGKQLTIVFHMDDLLISHRSAAVVTEVIKQPSMQYGSRDELSVTRGAIHEHLGMTVDFSTEGECSFSQHDYLKKLLRDLPEDLKATYRNTPAPEYPFKTTEDSPKLDSRRKELFHNIVAKILWLSQRSRPDTQLATGFLCTRVQDPCEHDWNKLGHLCGYLYKTRYLPLIIAITEEGAVIYIDGAHAVHMDAKGHSGLVVSQGKGAMISVSKKLGVVTTSSTETEIVSTGERLPKCTWFRYFRLAQGEGDSEDILMQDNKSAIILQKNYPYSTRKGTKHVHVRYYFAVDKVQNKELKLVYCPTEKMLGDYNSKPLQGKLFYDQRNRLMGVKEEDFAVYKSRYATVLKQYDLFDDKEEDLNEI